MRDERDIASLRRMCDGVETHYRGLEALGIEQATYSAIVVPAILDRLPESVRLTITRGTDFHEWSMEDLLTPLKHEVELREEHHEPERKSDENKKEKAGKEILRQRMPCLRSLAMGLKSVLSVWGIIATKTASEWRTPINVRKFLKSTHVVLTV